jgi:V/A-type H+-transporting ATPase subunit I
MIVPMKKAFVVTRSEDVTDTLRRLRRLGILHVSAVPAQVLSAQEWREKKAHLEKALALTGAVRTPGPGPGRLDAGGLDGALAAARSILDKDEALRLLSEESAGLEKEAQRLRDWEGVSLSDLRPLREKGVEIRFFEIQPKQLALIPPGQKTFIVRRGKARLWIALIHRTGAPAFDPGFKPLDPPGRRATEVAALQARNRAERRRLRRELDELGQEAGHLERAVLAANREIELAEATAAMGHRQGLSYLSGYLPAEQVGPLKDLCRENGLALLLRDPDADEDVPTIVRNTRWIDIIQPVFQLLGTIPGYREFDISFFFLLFFTFFFAAIIGDAGYGLIFFAASLFLRRRSRRRRQEPPAILSLLLILSAATVLWGMLTGTWFGSQKLAALPFLSWIIVPALSSFNPRSAETFKIIFFSVGAAHIVIAHFWSFLRQAREKPFIRSLAQLGWLVMVLGLYRLVLNLVIDSRRFPVPVHARWMIGGGLLLVIAFSRQEGRFLRGLAMGAANLLTTFLSSISAFSDIISYIRLFAVGLATVEIAKSFNAMAAGFGGGALGITAGFLVLLLGHALNMVMGALSVVVHGVRLNMLEFSGHLGMEWSGKPYKPFKE